MYRKTGVNYSLVRLFVFQFMKICRIVHSGCFVQFQIFVFKTGLETKAYNINLSFELQMMKGGVKICLNMLEGSPEVKW